MLPVEGGIGVLLTSFSFNKSSFLLPYYLLKCKQSFVSWLLPKQMIQQRGSDSLLKCKQSIVLWLLPKQMTQQRGAIIASSAVVSLFFTNGIDRS